MLLLPSLLTSVLAVLFSEQSVVTTQVPDLKVTAVSAFSEPFIVSVALTTYGQARVGVYGFSGGDLDS